ncbi:MULTISPECIES: NADPH-dependent FMN reductase [unclassified Sulfitobacter]|uniref:NADPH-dependent FMN reductase n=1 Tax=unclassified Sulfitobacter TaxID=196795 RepID=UPI0007C33DF0|nr:MULTISPECIES: NAD(P)H-dependent oxidoreductase [unclassified Sulfitobacter]KZX97226.1 NADPH-dependent FMN reductase [Sulfitobacter sp. HI0023]KZY24716.1 NADPH-dependent FMN reductase [Sulfitobacter sp. HI0040]KZZ70665.1 NADPH-dependent FMN reductase [Sulfitobacter sp. HI0129]
MTDPEILTICGSLRAGSSNRMLLAEAVRLFGPCRHRELDIRLPLYDGDVEEAEGVPPEVREAIDCIARADAVIISTPEYNKGPSGALKNALDWISRTPDKPWTNKPVAVMSAAMGRAGGERAQLILRTFMVPFRTRLLQGPEVHLARSRNAFDEDGRLVTEHYVNDLTELMKALRAEIER